VNYLKVGLLDSYLIILIEVRFSLVGMWNDTTYLKFKAPKPKFKSRTFSAKDYFNQQQSEN